jgi:choline dehydrogenase-like flavoprotein
LLNRFVNLFDRFRYGQAVGTDLCPLVPTAPQENMGNRSLSIATGKLLGGGSAVNGLVWVRPSKTFLFAS